MGFFRTILPFLILAALPARADETPIDVVLVVDVSGEMERDEHAPRARQLLLDLVDRIAQPGAQIAVIPFGDGVHEPKITRIGHGDAAAAEARARLRQVIEGLRSRDPHRYLHAAIERGVRQLRSFARRRSDRERRLVVVSGGARRVPAEEGGSALPDRLAAAGEGVLRPGRDWSLWYGHFGDGDEAVLEYAARPGVGVALPLDRLESMRWTTVRIETPFLSVGELPEGAWRRRVRIFVHGVPGTELAFRGHAGDGPATLAVAPARARLKRARSTVALDLSGRLPANAAYRGPQVRVDGVGPGPVWVTGGRLAVDVGADRARATLEHTELAFGRVDRGTKTGKIVRLSPNEGARRRQARLDFEVRDVPPDVEVTVEPASVRLDQATEVTVHVAPRSGATPGTYESRVVLQPRDGLRLPDKEIHVRYEVGHGSVRIEGDALAFGDVVRGSDKVARLTLVPDLGAVESGVQITVSVENVPSGVQLELLEKFSLFGKTALEVRARVSTFSKDGPAEARLRFEANGNVRVIPDSVPVTIRVVPPPSVNLRDVVDVGRVRQSELDGFEFSFPVDIDRAHHGTVVEFVPQAAGTRLDPPQARLHEGRQWLRFKLVSNKRKEGKQAAQFAVFSMREGSRRAEGHLRLVWTVEQSYLRLLEWRNPAPLTSDSTLVHGTLVLDASPDLRGRLVRVRTRFNEPEAVSRIAAGLDAIELLGGSQSVSVPIDVVSAKPGQYDGVMELSLHDPKSVHVAVKPVPFRVVVPEPPAVIQLLSPDKRMQLYTVAGVVAGLLLCLFWLVRRNRRPTRRMVRFVPTPPSEGTASVVDAAEMFAFEEELR